MAYVRKPYFKYPQANGLRMVVQSGPVEVLPAGVGQNYLNTLLAAMDLPGFTKCKYWEKVVSADTHTLKFRTSYSANSLDVKRESDNVTVLTIAATKLTNLVEQTDTQPGQFTDGGSGQTQIHFVGGMPDYFLIGGEITVTGNVLFNGTYTIQDIRPGTGDAIDNLVLVITLAWPGGPSPGAATVGYTYDIEPFDEWKVVIDFSHGSIPNGKYYLVMTSTHGGFTNVVTRSEPIEKATSWPDTLLIQYKCFEEGFLMNYSDGLEHRMRIEGYLQLPTNGGESEAMVDSKNKPIVLRENVTLLMDFKAVDLPFYILNRLSLAFAHDVKKIDGTEYSKDEHSIEYPETSAFGDYTAKLLMSDYEQENGNDETSQDVDGIGLEVNGTILELT